MGLFASSRDLQQQPIATVLIEECVAQHCAKDAGRRAVMATSVNTSL